MDFEKKWYFKQEVASIFGVSVRTIDRWREKGLLECNKLGPGKNAPVRFAAAQIRAFIERTHIQLREAV